eukprot:7591989-Pyramimonas_sp.AAC.1
MSRRRTKSCAWRAIASDWNLGVPEANAWVRSMRVGSTGLWSAAPAMAHKALRGRRKAVAAKTKLKAPFRLRRCDQMG